MKPYHAQIPLVLLTGFLGSGKTTLLRELLLHPQMSDTAVLINELGAVGLDHHLVWGASEALLVLENGCICCSVRDDFISALQDLFWKRLHRQIPRFARVVIETTGIADPGPIVHAVMSDSLVAERYRLDAVITTVDAMLAQNQLDRHWESVKQVAAADVLLVTKVDLAKPADVTQLEQRLAQLNPFAAQQRVAHGQIEPDLLFGSIPGSARRTAAGVTNWKARPVASTNQASYSLRRPAEVHSRPAEVHSRPAGVHSRPTGVQSSPVPLKQARVRAALHDSRIRSFTLHLHGAMERDQLLAALAAVLAQHGSRLLRIKGLVDIVDEVRPVVLQAVGDTIFPPQTLDAWPGGERAGSLVFITNELGPQPVCDVLALHMPGRVSLAV
jgi:G3E family GTPase